MFKVNTPKLFSFVLLAAALLFASATVVAQESPAPKQEAQPAAVVAAETADAVAPKPDALEVAAAKPEAPAPRVEFDLTAARLAAIDRAAKTDEPLLFVSDRFEWQQNPDPQATPTPQPTRTPLTPEQKMRRAAKNAFLSPVGYGTTIFSAAITEYTEDDLPHKTTEDRFADFASRFAIRFTTRATNTIFGQGVYAVAFKQDPRYYPSKSKNLFKRAAYAASRVFVTYDDDGNLEPNYSRWAGSLTSSAIANLYEQSTPGRDRIGTDATFRRFGSSFTSGMINNIIREFIGDLF